MHFGVSMFHTDYSIPAVELARALEARGFESMWAPEHSHIPVPRRTPFPGGGELPKPYYDVMDPFVVDVIRSCSSPISDASVGWYPTAEGMRPRRADTSDPACVNRKMLSMNSSTS